MTLIDILGSFALVCFGIIAFVIALAILAIGLFIGTAILAGLGEAVGERKRAKDLDKQHTANPDKKLDATVVGLVLLLGFVAVIAGCGEKCCDTKCCPPSGCQSVEAKPCCGNCHQDVKGKPKITATCRCKDGCTCCPKCGETCRPCPTKCSPNCPGCHPKTEGVFPDH